MKLTIISGIVLIAFLATSNGQLGGIPGLGFGGPPIASAGWFIGQEASKNAVSLAINGALAKTDPATLPPELQGELQLILDDAEISLASCDDLLLTSTHWRYKICKFQELSKIKARLLELKLKAAAAATAAPSDTNQFESASQSTA